MPYMVWKICHDQQLEKRYIIPILGLLLVCGFCGSSIVGPKGRDLLKVYTYFIHTICNFKLIQNSLISSVFYRYSQCHLIVFLHSCSDLPTLPQFSLPCVFLVPLLITCTLQCVVPFDNCMFQVQSPLIVTSFLYYLIY